MPPSPLAAAAASGLVLAAAAAVASGPVVVAAAVAEVERPDQLLVVLVGWRPLRLPPGLLRAARLKMPVNI